MSQAIATSFSLLFLTAGFVGLAWVLAVRITPENKRSRILRWLLFWTVRGLIVPVALWALINIGLSWNLQPFMPGIQAAQNRGGPWMPEYLRVVCGGLLIVSSYWSAITLGWLLTTAALVTEAASRKDFKALCLGCVLGLGIPAGIILLLGGLMTAGAAATLILAPMVGYGRDILRPRKVPPMYARAVARIKFGKYAEAESEIIKELENWEDDFEGWLMLAELYANHFNDLGEAERTVIELCEQPTVTSSQMSVALHRLAEWHLKLAQDPIAARRVLQLICDRLKGTHLAHMAQLRINQLPASALELRDQQTAQKIPLPALGDQLDLPPEPTDLDRGKAAKLANACVEQLKQNPNNVAAREKLARILVEHLDKALAGIEQVTLLLEMPDRSDAERAGWLGLIASWHIKYRQDLSSGRKFLERLVQEFPDSAQAFAARRRLELLDRKLKDKAR